MIIETVKQNLTMEKLLRTAFRNISRNKLFSIINIIGFSCGISVVLLIALYIKFETSYEDFLRARNIYRVSLNKYINNEQVLGSAENFPGVGPALKNELPEVLSYARLYNMGYKNNVVISNEEANPPINFKQRKFLYADSAFLPMFGYNLLFGNSSTALSKSNTAVISENLAAMYFGKENPLGKVLHMKDDDGNNEFCTVTGVFSDLPLNTHLKFEVLFSYKTLFNRGQAAQAQDRYNQNWYWNDMYTYVQLSEGSNPSSLEIAFQAVADKYNPRTAETNQSIRIKLQPIKDIHLNSNLAEEAEPNGDSNIVFSLSWVGIFVLLLAWINYVNLTTANFMERAKQVSVRKLLGAVQTQLIVQFLVEAAIMNMVSLVVAFCVIESVMPLFNSLSGLSLKSDDLFTAWFLITAMVLCFLGTLFSGIYLAFFLSSFKPVSALKGNFKDSQSGIKIRGSLVVFQFIASFSLIVGTLIVYSQLQFMMTQDLGIDINHVIVLERPAIDQGDESYKSGMNILLNELGSIPQINAVSNSQTVPGYERETKDIIKVFGTNDNAYVSVRTNTIDFDFDKVYNIETIAGTVFTPNNVSDPRNKVVITRSTSRILGFKEPQDALGQKINIEGASRTPTIIGVLNDYHQVSLKKQLEPMIFYFDQFESEFLSIRFQSSDPKKTMEQINSAWKNAFPGNPIDYFFLDDYFNRQYQNEQRFEKLFTVFAALAVIVSCLGLFGLSAYASYQRTKEIGIRKVLGSSAVSIFILLSKTYSTLISMSMVIASPIIYFIMNQWLSAFPYRITISIGVFVLSGVTLFLISILTVSYQTLKAASANPINSLRDE